MQKLPEEGGMLSKCVLLSELEDPGANSFVAPNLRLLIYQVENDRSACLNYQAGYPAGRTQSHNRTCLCKCSMGQWYVTNEPAIAEPQNGSAHLRMCRLCLAL